MASTKKEKKKRDTNKKTIGRKKNVKKAAETLIENPTKDALSPAEQKFCRIYASDIEFFGNGTQSYIEAFNVEIIKGTNKKNVPEGKKGMTIEAVRTAAHKLLTSSNILKRIEDEMEEIGFNDAHADKTLAFLMTQRSDMRVALGAAAEYNKLKSRIVQREAHFHGFAADDMTDEELDEIIRKQEAFFKKK